MPSTELLLSGSKASLRLLLAETAILLPAACAELCLHGGRASAEQDPAANVSHWVCGAFQLVLCTMGFQCLHSQQALGISGKVIR